MKQRVGRNQKLEKGGQMIKRLRSLIHERFSPELLLELEILSRRRDIINQEKQEALILLLRKHNIDDIVQLGSGTNRYAFKMDGYAIKFATDNDGKIDNFKEFKMAKRLYPHVIAVHEISRNGTMMVTEYIQPFSSWDEMVRHEDAILDILTQLSSVYLIGDVGFSSVNFKNWGTRIGTNIPVCLDFAYVYAVKSNLFVCTECKTNSIIRPDKYFVKLYCSNPGCPKKEYQFSDIRAKIGNDVHNHEIGDLTEEGYLMFDSNVDTELTIEKSNYLSKNKTNMPEQEIIDEKPQFESFVMPKTIEELRQRRYI